MSLAQRLTEALDRAPRPVLVTYAVVVAFGTYFGMYAFRKPFAAASFEGEAFLGSEVSLKSAMVVGQLIGYALSKLYGIRFVSQLADRHRGRALLSMILVAEGALFCFALVPGPYKVLALFVNGLPLGMVFGLVFRYLEGRRSSDVLLAGLSISFIVASGAVKDVGRFLMVSLGVSEAWMPFWTGAIFLPLFALGVWLLERLPPPDAEDVASRRARPPMDAKARRDFLRRYGAVLWPLFALYVVVTAYRDLRDNFGVELLVELGFEDTPGVFTTTEVPVALGVLVGLGLLGLFRDNRRGLHAAYAMMGAGAIVLIGVGAMAPFLDGLLFMGLTGLGSYLIYVPYNTVLFERFVAVTGTAATAVFGIYIADTLGYAGSIALMVSRDAIVSDVAWLPVFRVLGVGLGVIAMVLLGLSLLALRRQMRA